MSCIYFVRCAALDVPLARLYFEATIPPCFRGHVRPRARYHDTQTLRIEVMKYKSCEHRMRYLICSCPTVQAPMCPGANRLSPDIGALRYHLTLVSYPVHRYHVAVDVSIWVVTVGRAPRLRRKGLSSTARAPHDEYVQMFTFPCLHLFSMIVLQTPYPHLITSHATCQSRLSALWAVVMKTIRRTCFQRTRSSIPFVCLRRRCLPSNK